MDAHLAALESKHAGLEAQLDAEHQRPHPDEARVAKIKKEKLKLKDAMGRP